FGWRKTSGSSLRRALAFPIGAALLATLLHATLGARYGYPPIVYTELTESGFGAKVYAQVSSIFPGLTVSLSAMNIAVIIQEFWRGTRARMSSTEKKGAPEGPLLALVRLIAKSRRRYGGYVVHLGIVGMFLGFVGTAWQINDEVALLPGQSHRIADYELT